MATPAHELGERLRQLRVDAGLNQRELAARVGVGFPYISKIETGKEFPSVDVICRLAEVLGTDEDELLVMAEQIPADFVEVVKTRPAAALLLRAWHDGKIDDQAVEKLLKDAR